MEFITDKINYLLKKKEGNKVKIYNPYTNEKAVVKFVRLRKGNKTFEGILNKKRYRIYTQFVVVEV